MSYKEDGENLFPKDADGMFIEGGVDYLDTWKALEELVDAGLTRSIGVSNFNKRQIDRVVANGNVRSSLKTFVTALDLFLQLGFFR